MARPKHARAAAADRGKNACHAPEDTSDQPASLDTSSDAPAPRSFPPASFAPAPPPPVLSALPSALLLRPHSISSTRLATPPPAIAPRPALAHPPGRVTPRRRGAPPQPRDRSHPPCQCELLLCQPHASQRCLQTRGRCAAAPCWAPSAGCAQRRVGGAQSSAAAWRTQCRTRRTGPRFRSTRTEALYSRGSSPLDRACPQA